MAIPLFEKSEGTLLNKMISLPQVHLIVLPIPGLAPNGQDISAGTYNHKIQFGLKHRLAVSNLRQTLLQLLEFTAGCEDA